MDGVYEPSRTVDAVCDRRDRPACRQSEENLWCGLAPADVHHGGLVGLAAKAAATRGSRPNGLSPTLRGIEAHVDSPPTPFLSAQGLVLGEKATRSFSCEFLFPDRDRHEKP